MTDTETIDTVLLHRIAMIEELGFSKDEALQLAAATKLVSRRATTGKLYFTDWPISWHDVAKLIDSGASTDQVLRILL